MIGFADSIKGGQNEESGSKSPSFGGSKRGSKGVRIWIPKKGSKWVKMGHGITFPEPKLPVAGFSSFYQILPFLSSLSGFADSIKRGQKRGKSALIDLGFGVKRGQNRTKGGGQILMVFHGFR